MQSRHLVGRGQDEVIQLRIIDFADVFLKRETAEGLETACEIVWCHETCDTHAEKILIIIRIVFPSCSFDHTLHPIDLSIRPMVTRPEQTLPHSVRFPNQRKNFGQDWILLLFRGYSAHWKPFFIKTIWIEDGTKSRKRSRNARPVRRAGFSTR